MNVFIRISIVLIVALTPFLAFAGSLQISPVRISLTAEKPIAVMTLQNNSDTTSVIQLETVSWQQSMGEDIYTPTREILATPPIFSVPPRGTQIVRVGLQRKLDNNSEISYRLFLQEVPAATNNDGQVKVVLRFGIPIFVPPFDTIHKTPLAWRAVIASKNTLRIEAINHGNAHVQISGFSLIDVNDHGLIAEQQGMEYLLSKQKRHWMVSTVQAWPIGTRVKIIAQTDAGEMNAEAVLMEY